MSTLVTTLLVLYMYFSLGCTVCLLLYCWLGTPPEDERVSLIPFIASMWPFVLIVLAFSYMSRRLTEPRGR